MSISSRFDRKDNLGYVKEGLADGARRAKAVASETLARARKAVGLESFTITDKLVTIADFPSYIEAEMAKQLLANNGIKAVATGQNAANIYSIPSIESPKLQVLESQAQQARQILESNKKQEQ